MSLERLAAVRELFSEWEIDGLIITSAENYRWLSGFTGSSATLLVTEQAAYLGTDFRYWEQARQQAPEFELVRMGRGEGFPTLKDMITGAGIQRPGIEAAKVSVADYNQWSQFFSEEGGIEFVPLAKTLEGLREIKSAPELTLMRRAAAITDAAMARVNEIVRPGMTEKELAWELEKMMREDGADGLAFEIIVAAGPNGALAHHHPTDRPLQVGDAIVIDMGAKLDGYHSDLTRSFYLGNQPDEKFTYVYDLVLAAQQNALASMRAGMTGREIDRLAREVIEDAGHGDKFGHSLGHGVGLFIHETPTLSAMNEHPVAAGAVVTVEPGVYLPEWGGVRIEDLVILGEKGPDFLSHCPKNPIIPVA